MDPDTICPAYWPRILWPPPPPWRKELVGELDKYFATLAVAAMTSRLDRELGRQISGILGKGASNPMPGLVEGLARV